MAAIRAILEEFLQGKRDSLDFFRNCSREDVVEELNAVFLSKHPEISLNGEFVNRDQADYMVYDLHLSNNLKDFDSECIRVLDFGDKIKVVRI